MSSCMIYGCKERYVRKAFSAFRGHSSTRLIQELDLQWELFPGFPEPGEGP